MHKGLDIGPNSRNSNRFYSSVLSYHIVKPIVRFIFPFN